MEINIRVNTQNMKLDDKEVLRDKLQQYVDKLSSEIKQQHIINHKHK